MARAAGSRRPLYLHLPNSGRMGELLRPGAAGLAHLASPARVRPSRTQGALLLVRHRGRWVGLDARLPNRLFEAALQARALPPFRRYDAWRREVTIGGSRIDYALAGADPRCLVETKSCNRVEGGVARFPDAPTARGARHLWDLTAARRRGDRAAVVWFVQRDDAFALRPDADADPEFARAARGAAAGGVEFYAYSCRLTPRRAVVRRAIPVVWD